MNKEDLQVKDLFTGSVIERVDKTIRYIQKNAGAISLIVTFAIAFGSVLIKFMVYMIDVGYAYHFGISRETLEVSQENLIYSFFADGVIALFIFMLNFISYSILKSTEKMYKRIFKIVIFVIVQSGIIFFIMNSSELYAEQGDGYAIIVYVISSVLLSLIIISFGILFYIIQNLIDRFNKKRCKENKKEGEIINKDSKNKKIKETEMKRIKDSTRTKINSLIFSLAISILIYSIFIMFAGFTKAKNLREFRVLNEISSKGNYAVIYETSDSFIITECIIDESKETIDIDKKWEKMEIDKKNVEYSLKRLMQI